MLSIDRLRVPGIKTLLVACGVCTAAPALAFDLPTGPSMPSWSEETVMDALREGARAYYAGDKKLALDGLKSAADSGHPAAQWKLGRMYAEGDGVTEDDLRAFEYFNQIVSAHAEDSPSSPQAPYVSSAFVALGSYYVNGIDDVVRPNAGRAREIFTYAASYFGDGLAQTNLGRMYLEGIGGERDPRQAARWFLLAARKGQVEAQFRLGEMLTNGTDIEPNPVHGLMWLTVALNRAAGAGPREAAIRAAHEAAFALSSEDVRRRATALADQWLADNPILYAASAAGSVPGQ